MVGTTDSLYCHVQQEKERQVKGRVASEEESRAKWADHGVLLLATLLLVCRSCARGSPLGTDSIYKVIYRCGKTS
jgi:hypothetical protein